MHILIIKVVHGIGDTASWCQLFIVRTMRKAVYDGRWPIPSQKLVLTRILLSDRHLWLIRVKRHSLSIIRSIKADKSSYPCATHYLYEDTTHKLKTTGLA